MKKGILILIVVLYGFSGKAQLIKRPFIIEPKFHMGMNLPFYKALDYLIEEDIYAFDLSVSFPTYGKDYWEKIYRYPRQGLGLSCWSLGNNDVFGKAYVLYTFLNVPLTGFTGKFSINYQIAGGIAYLPKNFNVYTNHLNRAIGSQGNVYIHVGMDGKLELSSRFSLLIEAGFTHFSNGKTRSPNYGINAGTVSLGCNYIFNEMLSVAHNPEIPAVVKKYYQSVFFSAGVKVYDNLSDIKYLTTSLSYNLERAISLKRKLGLGADLSYDGSIREDLSGEDGMTSEEFNKFIRFGMHASYAVRYKQLVMGIQAGYYLYAKSIVITPVYNKISLQYLLPRNLAVSIAVKSHMAKADCFEYGLGYYW